MARKKMILPSPAVPLVTPEGLASPVMFGHLKQASDDIDSAHSEIETLRTRATTAEAELVTTKAAAAALELRIKALEDAV